MQLVLVLFSVVFLLTLLLYLASGFRLVDIIAIRSGFIVLLNLVFFVLIFFFVTLIALCLLLFILGILFNTQTLIFCVLFRLL